jgi:hypothetical protein
MKKFKAPLGDLHDPRAANARHPLLEVLFIALAVPLCGAQSCVDMGLFARSKQGFPRQIVTMERGPPSHDSFSRVFGQLDPEAFEAAFMAFTRAFAAKLESVVAIDGKAPETQETSGFPGASVLARVDAVRQTADGVETINTRYFILSAPVYAERLARHGRASWPNEYNIH